MKAAISFLLRRTPRHRRARPVFVEVPRAGTIKPPPSGGGSFFDYRNFNNQ
jgi:hypothetical protein